jgi:hypothetical protein
MVVSNSSDGTERKLMDMAPLFQRGPVCDVTSNGDIIWVCHEEKSSAIWLTELAAM